MIDKKTNVRKIFDNIAFRYDLLNHLLSFGIDYRWRRKALKLSQLNDQSVLLDVACGTGDFAITAYKMGIKKIIGADYSYNMLKLFSKKVIGLSVERYKWLLSKCPSKIIHSQILRLHSELEIFMIYT